MRYTKGESDTKPPPVTYAPLQRIAPPASKRKDHQGAAYRAYLFVRAPRYKFSDRVLDASVQVLRVGGTRYDLFDSAGSEVHYEASNRV